MPAKNTPTPKEREVRTLFERGKSPDAIAIRMGIRVSKVLAMLSATERQTA